MAFAPVRPDKGADIPTRTDYVGALKPLLDRVGACAGFTLILFTLDESATPRAGAAGWPLSLPAARCPWWFHDSPEGMLRFRRQTTETAGFYNTAASPTTLVPSCRFPPPQPRAADRLRLLAELVVTGRLDEDEAAELAIDLAYNSPRRHTGCDGEAQRRDTRPRGRPGSAARYDFSRLRPGIVHLGLGAFHRAHQAVFTRTRFWPNGETGA